MRTLPEGPERNPIEKDAMNAPRWAASSGSQLGAGESLSGFLAALLLRQNWFQRTQQRCQQSPNRK